MMFISCEDSNVTNDSSTVELSSIEIAPAGDITPFVLDSNQIDLDLIIETSFRLKSINLMFGNYYSDEKNLDYSLILKLMKDEELVFDVEYTKKIRDNSWIEFETPDVKLVPGNYVFGIMQTTDENLVMWSKEQKLWTELKGFDLGTIYVSPQGEITQLFLRPDTVSLDLTLDEKIQVGSIDLMFGNFSTDSLNLDYILSLKLRKGAEVIFAQEYLKQIRNNVWTKFEFPPLDLTPGLYKIELFQVTQNNLVLWSKNEGLWAKLDP